MHTDGRLTVHETITVDLDSGRRGIFRDFPTTYTASGNLKSCVDFDVNQVLLNGSTVQNCLENLDNGIRIKIGDPYKKLMHGTYTYDIFYTTARQLGFFADHDELYWNVTGNGWRMPIDSVKVTLHLPKGVQIKSVEAYTGCYGSKGSYYSAKFIHNHEAVWQTTRPLGQGEGLTLVATWPKGIISAPTSADNLKNFIRDNIAIILLLLGVLFSVIYAIYVYVSLRKEKNKGIIIPLFTPPDQITPAQTRYLMEYGYDHIALAAQLIDMAVHGLITIEKKKSFLSSHYEIKRVDTAPKELVNEYKTILECLFRKSNPLRLQRTHSDSIEEATTALKNQLLIGMGQYLDHQDHHIVGIMCMGFISIAFYFMFGGAIAQPLFWVASIIYCFACALVWSSIKCYTSRGKKLRDQVEGFKLFLTTTEQERLPFISTPPIRTPELYEKYLPYAVALGVEEQWTAQFASVFAQLKEQGIPYIHRWYAQDLHRYTSANNFAHIGSTLGHSISNSVPGSSSGSGGRGSSGGGGGGGGGGAW